MKKMFPPSPAAGRSAKRLRRYAVLALCAALLTFIVASSYAQKRAVRVAPGESAPAAAPAKSRKESERERERRRRARRQDDAVGAGGVEGEIVCEPLQADAPVQRTSEEVMSAQSSAPEVLREPRAMVEHEIEGREFRPQAQDAVSTSSSWPPSASSTVTRGTVTTRGTRRTASLAPQTLGTSFDGATGPTETGAFPPDSMGAVGPTQYFVFVNGRMRTFNKATGAADGVLNVDPDVFFSPVLTTPLVGEVVFTSDPNVRYDRLSGRWFLTIIDVVLNATTGATTRPNRILIAVSDAASSNAITPSTVWTLYQFAGDATRFTDYPSLGIDANALYIGGDMFTLAGSFSNTKAFIIPKAPLLTGATATVWTANNLITNLSTGDGPLEPRGVDNYDPANTGASATGYFIGASYAAFGRLVMRRVTNPGSTTTAPTVSSNLVINTPLTTAAPPTVPHLGNTGGTNGNLDSLDDRLMAAHLRNGRLWTAHNIGVNSSGVSTAADRAGTRWYELSVASTGTPTVAQSGTLYDNAATSPRHYFIPTLTVSGQGHVALGTSIAGAAERINAFTTGRLAGDAAGAMRDGPGVSPGYTNTTFSYNPPGDPGPPRRWGDYSFTSLDPKDDMTMWTIQEYCNGANTYGVRVAKLAAPPPATPNNFQTAVPAGLSSVSVVVYANADAAGSGFYDPGPNLAAPALPFNHLTAGVSGGVVVNSVTYNSPTQVTLNLNTTGAAPGPKSLTITNPDGQSVTAGSALYVGNPPASPLLITEFRFRGPAGASDEFVELYNNTDSPVTVADTNGGAGYAVAGTNTAGASSTRCTVPNGTVIPARGHFLCTNTSASGYSLGAAAAGDAVYTTGIVDGGGVAVFSTTNTAAWGTATRFDAVGFVGISGTGLFSEGGLTPAGGITAGGEYSFVRKSGTLTAGLPQDSNDNQSDFVFVSTDGAPYGRGSVLGAPGPENLASPVVRNASMPLALLDPLTSANNAPNRDRDFTSNPPLAPLGTMTLRRTLTNNTGATVTRLRFRIVDFTTFNSPPTFASQAQLRAVNSGSVVVTVNGNPVTVEGTSIETPPAQANGGGLNTGLGRSLAAGTIVNTPVAPGASVNVQFVLGVVQSGNYRFYVNVEALP